LDRAIKDNLEELIQLQNIDSQIHQLEECRGDLPQLVESLQKSVTAHKENITTITERIEEYKKQITQINYELEDFRERRKLLHDKLYKATNNREYNAFTEEIKFVDEKIEENESLLLDADSKKEIDEEKLKAVVLGLDEHEKELTDAKNELIKKDNETATEMEILIAKKEEIEKHLPKKAFSRYQRIAAARDGLAVVPVEVRGNKSSDGSCGGCFQRISPQDLIDIRAGNKILTCGVCGRILYWKSSQE